MNSLTIDPIRINNQEDFDHAVNAGLIQYLIFKAGSYRIRQTIDLQDCYWICPGGGDLYFYYLEPQGTIFMVAPIISATLGGWQKDKFDLIRAAALVNQTNTSLAELAQQAMCNVHLITFHNLDA